MWGKNAEVLCLLRLSRVGVDVERTAVRGGTAKNFLGINKIPLEQKTFTEPGKTGGGISLGLLGFVPAPPQVVAPSARTSYRYSMLFQMRACFHA